MFPSLTKRLANYVVQSRIHSSFLHTMDTPWFSAGQVSSIAVVGDCFLDIEAPVGNNPLPQWGGDCRCKGPILSLPGGSALNVATHVASLSGKPVSLYSRLGNDTWANVVKDHCAKRGVNLIANESNTSGTGTCIILSGTEDRAFVTHYGAVAEFSSEEVEATLKEKPDVLHIAGYFSTTKLQSALPDMIRKMKAENPKLVVSLDTNYDASELWGREEGEETGPIDALLPLIDMLLLSEEEAKGIARKTTVSDAILCLCALCPLVVVTLGSKGCLVKCRGCEVVSYPAKQVEVVSTVGAGDAFKAGLLAYLSRGNSLTESIQYATASGALAVTATGASTIVLDDERVMKLAGLGV